MKRMKIWAIVAVSIVIFANLFFIYSNSFQSGEVSNSESESISEAIQPIIDPNNTIEHELFHFFVRKTAHFAEFFALGAELAVLSVLISCKIFTTLLFMPPFFSLLAAVVDEYIQSFGSRTSIVSDILLDFTGSVCGILFTLLLSAAVVALKNRRSKAKD